MPDARPYDTTPEQFEQFQDQLKRNIEKIMSSVKDRPSSLDSEDDDDNPTNLQPGRGIGAELANFGYHSVKTNAWKTAVKDWFKSCIKPAMASDWRGEEPRYSHVFGQFRNQGMGNVRLPRKPREIQNPNASRILIFVDISGSVWQSGIQRGFTSLIKALRPDEIECTIFTFNDGINADNGPFTIATYNPTSGSGGTDPWQSIDMLLKMAKYKNMDGYCMLTDGGFAHPPAGLIKKPREWCFIMTSEYSADALPSGVMIIETYLGSREYTDKQRAKKGEGDTMTGSKRKE
jgi:hypothetical protein